MEKYLGNKSSILPLIDTFIQSRIPDANSLCDIFAGTTNVSRYFRCRGWATAACDSNRFSYVLGQAYLNTTQPPQFDGLPALQAEPARVEQARSDFYRAMSRYGELYVPIEDAAAAFDDLAALADVLCYLQAVGEGNERPGVISDSFTQWGRRAEYVSMRGTTGVRNYFSRRNALFLDGVMEVIRRWWSEGRLTRGELFLLMTSVIEEVVITANVNGTFHDFNRDKLWPNALQPFQLRVPLVWCHGTPAELANADAMVAVDSFRRHDVCYLDPPYNFRQYNAYYHFLNYMAAYPFIDDVDSYMNGLAFVRGQNPDDDFTSALCSRSRFISGIRRVIEGADASHVIMSYYGGRNHWNHWSAVTEPTDEGLHEIRSLFNDTGLFERCEVIPALEVRRNYQSRVGERKELVNEYLFHGVLKQQAREGGRRPLPPLPSNDRWGLGEHFGHFVPG